MNTTPVVEGETAPRVLQMEGNMALLDRLNNDLASHGCPFEADDQRSEAWMMGYRAAIKWALHQTSTRYLHGKPTEHVFVGGDQ